MSDDDGHERRHLVSSELFREDVLEDGHEAIWGSFYDAEGRSWGYACCRGTSRHQPCANKEQEPEEKRPRRARRASSEDSESEQRKFDEKPVDWSSPPEDLRPRGEVGEGSAEEFIEHFVRYAVGAWQRELEGGLLAARAGRNPELKTFVSVDALRQAEASLSPLLRQLRQGTVNGEILKHLDEMASRAANREYAAANKAYMELTIGNKKWQNVLAGAQGKHNKGGTVYLMPQSALTAYDSDPVAQKYMQALRRVILFAQYKRPNDDVSKHM